MDQKQNIDKYYLNKKISYKKKIRKSEIYYKILK